MATNPMFNNRTSPNGATAPNNPANTSDKRYSRKHNKYDYSRKVYNTLRFSEITPFESVRGVEADVIPLGSKHQIRTFTFKSPLMSDIFIRKTFFHVDYRCILPMNWDKWYKAPQIGDDVSDSVGTSVDGFLYHINRLNEKVIDTYGSNASSANATTITVFVKFLLQYSLMVESLFSSGSLLASLGCHLQGSLNTFDNNTTANFDSLLESFFYELSQIPLIYIIDGVDYSVPTAPGNVNKVPFRVILDLIRHAKNFMVSVPSGIQFDLAMVLASFKPISDLITDSLGLVDENHSLNLDVLYAYQIVCSQFYTNTNVDYIYTAELYRENQGALLKKLGSVLWSNETFTYNGITCNYDVCSGRAFYFALNQTISQNNVVTFGNYMSIFFDYWRNIFFYQRSLKYGDYFTGCKTRPLAVGDVNVTVNSGQVSAIDITRNVMRQRFLNAVNRVRNTMSDYLSKVLDGTVSPRDDEPRFLASVKSKLSGFEVENTSSTDQGKLVKVINSSDSNYIYEVSVGSPCIILGLASFEVPSVYSRGIERFFMNKSREDMFNPFMQYIGDQSIYRAELTGELPYWNIPFGYQMRHAEYKQRTSYASGGFVNDKQLQSYLFLVDNVTDLTPPPFTDIKISPEFIRNKNYELDRFYSSLSGYSLSNYFHFIVEFTNICNPSREMDYSPTIL